MRRAGDSSRWPPGPVEHKLRDGVILLGIFLSHWASLSRMFNVSNLGHSVLVRVRGHFRLRRSGEDLEA